MSSKTLGQWSRSILPDHFGRVNHQLLEINRFLMANLPESVNQQVSAINISDKEIVIAAASAQVANYVRLYVREIQQQIHETFHLSQILKIRTVPESLLKIEHPPPPGNPARVSGETVEAISRGADWIEDEALRRALQSLAETLEKGD